jgi:hypothetical protein
MLFLLFRTAVERLHRAALPAAAARLPFHAPFYFLLLVILGSLSLETSYIYLVAAVGSVFEALLLVAGGVFDGTVVVFAVTGTSPAVSCARRRSAPRSVSCGTSRESSSAGSASDAIFSPEVAARLEDREAEAAGETREVTSGWSTWCSSTARHSTSTSATA